MNWSEADYKIHMEKRGKTPVAKNASANGLQALGRLPKGTMNKTEALFAQYLDMQKIANKVLWYKFEGIKLMLAPNTSITVDFAVLSDTGILEMIDVKGAKAIFSDDARAKMKIAAATYPFVFKVAYPIAQKDGGGWKIEEI